MPIVKHRDNFSEILSRAASKKVVNQVRSTDTLYQIQEDASSKSRRLSTKLVGSLRLRPLKSSGSIGMLQNDQSILEDIYRDMAADSANASIVNFDVFLKFTETKDSSLVRRVFNAFNCDDQTDFEMDAFVSGLWKFCPLDEVDLGLFIFQLYLEDERDGWSIGCIQQLVTDLNEGVSFSSEEHMKLFRSSLEGGTLERSKFMEIYRNNKALFNPLRKWRMSLIKRCGGLEFWKDQMNFRYKNGLQRSDSSSRMLQSLITNNFVIVSSFSYSIVKSKPFYALRFFASVMAFVFIILQTSDVQESKEFRSFACFGEIVIDSFFIMEGIMKLTSIKAHLQIQDTLGKTRRSVPIILWSSGVQSAIASVLSLSFGRSVVGDWAKLCRLIFLTSISLRRLENIDVLMSGIVLGSRSLLSTWLLLLVVFIIYSACAMTLFGENDPAHFGSMATSLFTFFQISTFDGWGPIMYINTYGCDQTPSDYVMYDHANNGEGTQLSYERFGTMYMAVCHSPIAHPIVAPMLFMSFVVVSGFILISLTVAVVTSGIHDRLDELKDSEEGEYNKELQRISMVRQDSLDLENHLESDVLRRLRCGSEGSDSIITRKALNYEETLFQNKDMVVMILEQVWKDQDEYEERLKVGRRPIYKRLPTTGAEIVAIIDHYDIFNWQNSSMMCRSINSNKFYQYCQVVCIVLTVCVEILSIERSDESELFVIEMFQIVLQIFFMFDVFFRLHAHYPNWKVYFHDKWNSSDFAMMVVTFVPVFTYRLVQDDSIKEFIGLLSILRVLRVLRLLNWIRDLNVILRAIEDSALALSYVIVLLFLFFFHFAVAAVFLFAENDPYYFGNIGKAFITLFQVSTLDAWGDIARTNMYGCDLYGYQTGDDYFDDKCENPQGLGWLAAFYFYCFIVFGTMVLLSLFIGIIIASMEIIKQNIKDESEIWKKVEEVQTSRGYINSSVIANLLEVFDLLDVGANGVLTMIELKPLLELVSKSETIQYGIFMKVDKDYSGRVDFAEFLEFIHHLGIAYRHQKAFEQAQERVSPPKKDKKSGGKHASESRANWTLKNLTTMLNSPTVSPSQGDSQVEMGEIRQKSSPFFNRSRSMASHFSSSKSIQDGIDTEVVEERFTVDNIVRHVTRNAKVGCTDTGVEVEEINKDEKASVEDLVKTAKNNSGSVEKSRGRVIKTQLSFPNDVHYSDDDIDEGIPPVIASRKTTQSPKRNSAQMQASAEQQTDVVSVTRKIHHSESGGGSSSSSQHVNSSGEIGLRHQAPSIVGIEGNEEEGVGESQSPPPADTVAAELNTVSAIDTKPLFVETESTIVSKYREQEVHAKKGITVCHKELGESTSPKLELEHNQINLFSQSSFAIPSPEKESFFTADCE